MSGKVRPGRLAAFLVQWGDVLVTAPPEARVIGTVLASRSDDQRRTFTVRAPGGGVLETRPVAEERPVWVHVPGGSA